MFNSYSGEQMTKLIRIINETPRTTCRRAKKASPCLPPLKEAAKWLNTFCFVFMLVLVIRVLLIVAHNTCGACTPWLQKVSDA